MLLNVDAKIYTAHFTHRKEEFRRGDVIFKNLGERWVTHCVLHEGKCIIPKCAGSADESFGSLGRAVCNPGDQFSKSKGRIRSLTKALKSFDRPVRAQIWASYFKISPHK